MSIEIELILCLWDRILDAEILTMTYAVSIGN